MSQLIEKTGASLYSKLVLKFTECDAIFFLLVTLVYISFYYTPPIIGLFINVAVALYCYNSKYPLILLFLFLIVVTRMNGMLDFDKMPLLSMAGNSLSLLDMLALGMWIKVLKLHQIIRKSMFGSVFMMIYLVLFITVMINAVNSGIDKKLAINLFRSFSYYICYFYVLIAFKDISDFNFIFKVLFFSTILVLGNQLTTVIMSKTLNEVLFNKGPGVSSRIGTFSKYTGEYRTDFARGVVWDGVNPLLLLYSSLALIGLTLDKKMRNFLILSIAAITMITFIAATRAYVIINFLPFIPYTKNMQNVLNISKIVIITIVLLLSVFILIGGFGFAYFQDVLLRFSGLTKVVSSSTRGEVETAVARLNAAKSIIEIISKSPIVGYGFSRTTRALDDDLGFLNTLVIMGLLGLFVYLYLIIKFISTCRNLIRMITRNNPFRVAVNVFMFAMIGLSIGYATTLDFFSSGTQNLAFIAAFLGLAEIIFKEAMKYDATHAQENI